MSWWKWKISDIPEAWYYHLWISFLFDMNPFLFFSGIVWAVRSKPNTMNKPERNVNFICKCIQAGQLETITLKVKRKSAKESLKQVRYSDSQLFLHFHSWNGPIWESMTDPESHVISLTSWQNHSYKSFQIFDFRFIKSYTKAPNIHDPKQNLWI